MAFITHVTVARLWAVFLTLVGGGFVVGMLGYVCRGYPIDYVRYSTRIAPFRLGTWTPSGDAARYWLTSIALIALGVGGLTAGIWAIVHADRVAAWLFE